jgi:hypothetical protein
LGLADEDGVMEDVLLHVVGGVFAAGALAIFAAMAWLGHHS